MLLLVAPRPKPHDQDAHRARGRPSSCGSGTSRGGTRGTQPRNALARRIQEQQQHQAAADDAERVAEAALGRDVALRGYLPADIQQCSTTTTWRTGPGRRSQPMSCASTGRATGRVMGAREAREGGVAKLDCGAGHRGSSDLVVDDERQLLPGPGSTASLVTYKSPALGVPGRCGRCAPRQ